MFYITMGSIPIILPDVWTATFRLELVPASLAAEQQIYGQASPSVVITLSGQKLQNALYRHRISNLPDITSDRSRTHRS